MLAQGILEHTLFKGTYFPTWEGLFWEKVRSQLAWFVRWPRVVPRSSHGLGVFLCSLHVCLVVLGHRLHL